MDATDADLCMGCRRSEDEIPLSSWRYRGRALRVCPDCLPVFIHERHKLMAAGSLPGGQADHEEGGQHAS